MSEFARPEQGEAIPDVGAQASVLKARWRFLILVQIANYAMLRRHVGARRAETVTSDLAESLTSIAPGSTIRVVGRDQIEIGLIEAGQAALDALIRRIELLFNNPFSFDAEPYLIEVSVGAAAACAALCDEVRLLEEAEQALTEARLERRSVVRKVSRAVIAHDRVALGRDLPTAIRNGELLLQYQPKLHVRRQSIAGVEALVRWQHPSRGLVLPNDFIPLAEQSGDIVPLTLWTLKQAIADQRELRARGHDFPIFINIAGMLLTDTAFVRQACGLVQGSDAKLGFEITETSIIHDPKSAIANLNVFSDIGIKIAIDDYGAGLSSLAYLKQLPASELKIDKLFITQLTSSHRDPLIVRSTIDLAHALEMEVVAEGVETPAALALLSVMGCDVVQGFLISRPVCLDALLTFLSKHSMSEALLEPAALMAHARHGLQVVGR